MKDFDDEVLNAKETIIPQTIEMESDDEEIRKHTTGNDGPSWTKSYNAS
jgi:hypothetical protein